MRIGVLGGTFDPPHVGHLLPAIDAYDLLELDKLIFVPAATQPFKATDTAIASPEQRLAMVRLMVGGDPRFEVSESEIRRGGLSFTVDTLEELSREFRGAELVLILGADALAGFERWRSPERIRQLARLVMVTRGDEKEVGGLSDVTRISTRRIDVSSTEIRRRVREGKSIRGFVSDAVAQFIASENLYGEG